MRATGTHPTASTNLAVILALGATAAAAAVPPPTINGVVVEDVTRPFSFDRTGILFGEPFIEKDAFQGAVRSMVIKAPDSTFDFYFHITTSSSLLQSFNYVWQVPASYTVAYHVADPVVSAWRPDGPSGPAPGYSESDALRVYASWLVAENASGDLNEGVLVLDTDAKAYAATASYQLANRGSRGEIGFFEGQSPLFITFGPAIPEPETYALMLSGIGLLALARCWRRRNAYAM